MHYFILFYLLISILKEIFGNFCDNFSPQVLQRFSEDQLLEMCDRKRDWKQLAMPTIELSFSLDSNSDVNSNSGRLTIPQGRQAKRQFTENQENWFRTLENCYNLDCLSSNSAKYLSAKPDSHLNNIRQTRHTDSNINNIRQKRQNFGKVVRKEYRMLSDAERQSFHAALQKVKANQIDGVSQYDLMVFRHQPELAKGAHYGPAFLPFHREFLKQMELALRIEDPNVALPYWDSTMDKSLPDPRYSMLWDARFLGSGYGEVWDGPFSNWTVQRMVDIEKVSPNLKLYRNCGSSKFGLYTNDDIDYIMGRQNYSQMTYCDDQFFEIIHGSGHIWVGGLMGPLPMSPNDPIFYMLHSFVDYLWEQWRQLRQTRFQRENDYVEDTNICFPTHYLDSPMLPFSMKNKDGLRNVYTDSFYEYASRPSCSARDPYCGSKYLFCDTRNYKCLSKQQIGSNCQGYEGLDICYDSECIGGYCKKNSWGTTMWVPTFNSGDRWSTATTSTTTTTTTSRPWLPWTIEALPTTTASSTSSSTSTITTTAATTTTSTTSTTTTITTTNRANNNEKQCINEHRCCRLWATAGECARNPVYMQLGCAAACDQCSTRASSIYCVDIAPDCRDRFLRGQCTRRYEDLWMEENCKKTCNKCSRTESELARLCGVKDQSRCYNHHSNCPSWATDGECRMNAWWMKENCPKACNQCLKN